MSQAYKRGSLDRLEWACIRWGAIQPTGEKIEHEGKNSEATVGRVRFVLSHNTIFLYAPIVSPEGHRAPKGDSVSRRRIGDDLSRPNSRRKVAHITQRGCCLPPSFIHVFDLLRGLVCLASLVELKFQSL